MQQKTGLPCIALGQPGCLLETRGFPSPPRDGFGFMWFCACAGKTAQVSFVLQPIVKRPAGRRKEGVFSALAALEDGGARFAGAFRQQNFNPCLGAQRGDFLSEPFLAKLLL